MSIVKLHHPMSDVVIGEELYCDECGCLAHSDDAESHKFMSAYITVTKVSHIEGGHKCQYPSKHYCNDECMNKSESRSSKATTKTNEE